MKIIRAILSGISIWIFIFISFVLSNFIPIVKESESLQFILIYLIVIPIVIFGAKIYYKKEAQLNGLLLGLLFISIALCLDAIITLPLLIVPAGGSYSDFYLNPLLWLLVLEIMLITYFYWKVKIK